MSGKVTGLVLEADLPKDEKAVLLALADHAQHDGTRIYPSTDKLIWMTGYTRRSVQVALDKLEARGILLCIKRGGTGRYSPTVWRIVLENLPALPPFEEWLAAHKSHDGQGATIAPLADESARDEECDDGQGAMVAPLAIQGAMVAPLAVTDESKGAIYDSLGRNLRQLRAQSTTRKGAMVAPDPLCDPSGDPSENRSAHARAKPSPESRAEAAEAELASRERTPQLAHAYRSTPAAAAAAASASPAPSSAAPRSPAPRRNSGLTEDASSSAITTIGGREQYRAWHEVIDAINVSTAIKDNWLRPCKLYSFDGGGGDQALLIVPAKFAVEPVGRFHSTLESLVAQKLRRRGLRLVIRSVQEVRASEEALV